MGTTTPEKWISSSVVSPSQLPDRPARLLTLLRRGYTLYNAKRDVPFVMAACERWYSTRAAEACSDAFAARFGGDGDGYVQDWVGILSGSKLLEGGQLTRYRPTVPPSSHSALSDFVRSLGGAERPLFLPDLIVRFVDFVVEAEARHKCEVDPGMVHGLLQALNLVSNPMLPAY